MKRVARKILRKWRAFKNRPRIRYPHGDRFKGSFEVGEGSYLGKDVEIDCTGSIEIGKHCIISNGVHIHSHTHEFLYGDVPDIIAETGLRPTSVEIGDNVFIGGEAMILPQVGKIGDNAIIGARAVLARDVGPGEIWVGNPARRVGSRYDE